MPDPATIKTAIEFAKIGWDNKKAVSAVLSRIRRWWNGPHKILVIGSGGTGKTTLGLILSGEFDWLKVEPSEYKESFNVEVVRAKSSTIEAYVVPGQKKHRLSTWRAIEQKLAAGEFRGVIFVSSYGYHSFSVASLKQIKPGLAKEKALDEFIRQGQAEEVEMVKRLSPFIQASPRKMWSLTLVTKQDLWYPNRLEVESHYQTGEYAKGMERIVAAKGGQQFRHDVHFCSLVISNWVSSAKETLRKCVEGYDHKKQAESVRRLFEVVDALRRWEGIK
jgi:hypothetical protein